MNGIKTKLAIMNFLEFAVWGAYLTSLGTYLYLNDLTGKIGIFYAMQGIVSMFMPALIGIIADRWIQAQKMLSICHTIAGITMIGAGFYAAQAGDSVNFGPLFLLYSISVAFFMPTIGLANSVAYSALNRAGLDTIKHFPPVRVLGTVGFICAMLITNFTGFQNNYGQLFLSGGISLALAAYAFTMPACPTNKSASKSLVETLGLNAFKLFKDKQMALFFIFSMFLGVSLQITNGFANPFISSFKDMTLFSDSFGANNANALISLSQMSETLCILLIPFFLKRYGIKVVMLMSMFAWVFRFGFFGLGDPGSGVWLFVLSMIVYGIAFDFFNVSGSLYVDGRTDNSIRSSAQGLFMLMTNGIGATIGTLGAQAVINRVVPNFHLEEGQMYTDQQSEALTHGWSTAWFIFAAYALVVAILFFIMFKAPKDMNVNNEVIKEADDATAGDPEGAAI